MCVCRRVTAGQGRDHIASLCLVGWLVDVLCAGLPAAVDNAAVGSRIYKKGCILSRTAFAASEEIISFDEAGCLIKLSPLNRGIT